MRRLLRVGLLASHCAASAYNASSTPTPAPTFPTAAPTISPVPTLTPVPTFAFQCDNAMCTENRTTSTYNFFDGNDGNSYDCCAESPGCLDGSTPVIKDGHKCRVGRGSLDNLGRGDVIWGDLFTCCTGFQIPTDEELTASGFAWEDHKNHAGGGGGGGGGGGWTGFIIFFSICIGLCSIAAVAIVVAAHKGYCTDCCGAPAPKPRTASARAVELVPTASAVEVPATAGV